ncbi:hypothetical protein HMPREF9997_00322 [Corynebacterium durum F0235]|uniref:Uncharacterized protein n=1 Tax=Corynebacterium durum F0235 TaxID=1035195 RepID=L1ML86_9CORY|nr:hypothetical protein HMPREF9997_00322 [Corynebacterium durum F0235]
MPDLLCDELLKNSYLIINITTFLDVRCLRFYLSGCGLCIGFQSL